MYLLGSTYHLLVVACRKTTRQEAETFINGLQAFNIRAAKYQVELNLNLKAQEKREAAHYTDPPYHPLVMKLKWRDV